MIDLHARRTRLGTKLSSHRAPPQVAKRVMRHADFQTTEQHGTDLGDVDAEQALHAVPFDLEPAPRASLDPASGTQRKRQRVEPTPDPNPAPGIASGAAEGTRTLDIQLGKLTLYQLSYGRSRGERIRAGARERNAGRG